MTFEDPFHRQLTDEAATRDLAEDIAMVLRPGDVVALLGDLGAGKTTFARFLLRGLADDPSLEVPSPSFTLAQVYDFGRLVVTHFDFYRLGAADELDEIGFDDAIRTGAALIEWADRAPERLPADTLVIALSEDEAPDARRVTITPPSEAWRQRLARSFALRHFLNEAGRPGARRTFLQGDASTRSYERVHGAAGDAVVMNAPAQPDGPPVLDGLPYSRIAHLAEDVRPFVAIGETLRGAGFSAPAVLAQDLAQGLLLLEDLGGAGVVAADAPIQDRYQVAVELLADLHGHDWPRDIALADGSHHLVPDYDRRALAIEVALLPDWYIPHVSGAPLEAATRAEFTALWEACFTRLERAEKSWTLRDFHSPNLLWLAAREGIRRIGLLDYQDTVVGPSAYDLASLLQDARVTVAAPLEHTLFKHYVACRQARDPAFDAEGFAEAYAIMAAQRTTKVLGIFARLNDRDGKPAYLRHIPRIKAYLARSLKHPVLSDLRLWYERAMPADFPPEVR